jgi:hypothetical protein
LPAAAAAMVKTGVHTGTERREKTIGLSVMKKQPD